MLIGTPSYAPTILYSQNRMRSGRTLKTERSHGPFGGWQPGIYRLIMVTEGRHNVQLVGESFTADAGDAYLIQPGALRWVEVGPGSLAYALGFIVVRVPGAEIKHEQGQAYLLQDVSHHQPAAEEIWGHAIASHLANDVADRIRDDMTQAVGIAWRDQWRRAEADMLLQRMLWTIALATKPQQPASRMETGLPVSIPWLKKFERRVDERLPMLRNTADLARMAGVSTDHFAKVFKRFFSERPAVYLRRRRIEETARHLRHSDQSLAQIARLVGYRDASALVHAWRQVYDESPGRWRRKQSN